MSYWLYLHITVNEYSIYYWVKIQDSDEKFNVSIESIKNINYKTELYFHNRNILNGNKL